MKRRTFQKQAGSAVDATSVDYAQTALCRPDCEGESLKETFLSDGVPMNRR